MLVACRLAKSGYFQGDPTKVLQAPANIIEAILNYEDFLTDYKKAYAALNAK